MNNKNIFNLILMACAIIGILYFKLGFILGLLIGCLSTSMLFLFPNEIMLSVLDKAFGYSNKPVRMMQNETEKPIRNKIKFS